MKPKAIIGSVMFLLVPACAPGPRASLSASPTNTYLAPDEEEAVTRIAQVRARREFSCLPAGKRSDYDVAGRTTSFFRETVAQLHPESCKSNVHTDTFASCIMEIRDASCSIDLRDISTIEACTTGPLCGPRPNPMW